MPDVIDTPSGRVIADEVVATDSAGAGASPVGTAQPTTDARATMATTGFSREESFMMKPTTAALVPRYFREQST
jgi:hypothetical protein